MEWTSRICVLHSFEYPFSDSSRCSGLKVNVGSCHPFAPFPSNMHSLSLSRRECKIQTDLIRGMQKRPVTVHFTNLACRSRASSDGSDGSDIVSFPEEAAPSITSMEASPRNPAASLPVPSPPPPSPYLSVLLPLPSPSAPVPAP